MTDLADTLLRTSCALDSDTKSNVLSLHTWFHMHPELAFQEAETARHVVAALTELGVPCQYAGVGHAVIATIPGESSRLPIVALRAEMDALPGNESTQVTYKSLNPGKVHACGHCAHMAMLLGAAKLLVERQPPGPIRLIFQPAEEKGGGARTAIDDGALDGVASIYAVHVTHEYETGVIMIRDGGVTAQSDGFRVSIRGKGGHGARPHEAVDAVVVSGFLIMALQTLVSREANPLHPSVVTIGSVKAGSAANVIAETAELSGSVRTSLPESRSRIHRGLTRMVSAAAELHDANIELEIRDGYPPVVNDPQCCEISRSSAQSLVGNQNVTAADHPSMGSEDFSFYLERVPGCFARLGARRVEWEPTPLHSPAFEVDPRVLDIGTLYFDRVARQASTAAESV